MLSYFISFVFSFFPLPSFLSRAAQVAYNVLVLLFIGVVEFSKKRKTVKSTNSPVTQLLYRVALYPLIQSISRVGPTFYEFKYNGTIRDYVEPAPTSQTIAMFAFAVLAPITGILNFAVFLVMQFGAYDTFKYLILGLFGIRYVTNDMRHTALKSVVAVTTKNILIAARNEKSIIGNDYITETLKAVDISSQHNPTEIIDRLTLEAGKNQSDLSVRSGGLRDLTKLALSKLDEDELTLLIQEIDLGLAKVLMAKNPLFVT